MIRSGTLSLFEVLESIENSPTQYTTISELLSADMVLRRFFTWYAKTDFSDIQGEISYFRDTPHTIRLQQRISDLEGLVLLPKQKQIHALEGILSMLEDSDMMLLENCLTRNLKDLFPKINWVMIEKLLGFEL